MLEIQLISGPVFYPLLELEHGRFRLLSYHCYKDLPVKLALWHQENQFLTENDHENQLDAILKQKLFDCEGLSNPSLIPIKEGIDLSAIGSKRNLGFEDDNITLMADLNYFINIGQPNSQTIESFNTLPGEKFNPTSYASSQISPSNFVYNTGPKTLADKPKEKMIQPPKHVHSLKYVDSERASVSSNSQNNFKVSERLINSIKRIQYQAHPNLQNTQKMHDLRWHNNQMSSMNIPLNIDIIKEADYSLEMTPG